jgi:hypothetical protein
LRSEPKNLAQLQVVLQGAGSEIVLRGNTGAESDQWHYDKKIVYLHWWNIPKDDSKSEIEVRY